MICDEEELWVCALSLCLRYEGGLARRLYDCYGSAQAIFEQPPHELAKHKGMRKSLLTALKDPELPKQAARTVQWLQSKKVRSVFLYHPDYPYRLKECSDAPLLLYASGKTELNKVRVLSVVGTRKATAYGKALCHDIISGFTKLGLAPVIVSGLAFGIDVTAHKAALDNHLSTVAVLPTGIDEIYPASHRSVAVEIARKGMVISEFPPETKGHKKNFLQRNRIIAGLSDATLVVESAANGGALITAHLSLGYSRDVLAVPGRTTDVRSEGCNHLIKDNKAALVTCARDVAHMLQWDIPEEDPLAVQQQLFDTLEEQERQVLAQIHETGGDINALGEKLNMPLPELSAIVSLLQVKGFIKCMENKEFRTTYD